ncbi:MAG TPA: winged helix DNA-binding domain-containing protein [Polyangiaceae bacterium]|nr:winged helix DNA-binding domain-containing protein [Polyangiaceae bacterium]
MGPRDVVRLRLEAQRISATGFTRPRDVVAWLGAVQAQDYLGALWGVGLRLARARERDIEAALSEGSVVRTWPMRGTLHFVAAADARWMIDLLGPRVLARAAGRLRALGIDDATLARARRALERSLEGGARLTRAAVYDVLERAKVSVAGQRGIHILWRLAHDCFLCFGPREGKQHTFALFDEWLPGAKRLRRDEALHELARRYFGGHGPATVADFAWWSGLSASDARHAIHLAREGLVEEPADGQSHWFSTPAAPSPEPRARAYLLPAFDEFVVAYTDRSAAIESAHMIRVNAGGGILNPTIVVDGRIIGTWKRRIARGKVVFLPAPFAALSKEKTRAVASALLRYCEFLGIEEARKLTR